MSMNCHACAIDTDATAIASVSYDAAGGYSIEECRTIHTGIGEYCRPGGEKAANKLVSLLRKKQIDDLVLSIQTPHFFPLDTLFSRNISDRTFDAHCRAEAAFLLSKPGDFIHDHIPYAPGPEQNPVRKHLLLYYPENLFGALLERLRTCCSVSSVTHYLKPMIQSIAATLQPFVLLEIERGYATCSAGNNGELEQFSYWKLNHKSDVEYFALRELQLNGDYRQYPVYITGTLAGDKLLAERITNATGVTLYPFNLVDLYGMERNVRASCRSPIEQKALSTALINLDSRIPS